MSETNRDVAYTAAAFIGILVGATGVGALVETGVIMPHADMSDASTQNVFQFPAPVDHMTFTVDELTGRAELLFPKDDTRKEIKRGVEAYLEPRFVRKSHLAHLALFRVSIEGQNKVVPLDAAHIRVKVDTGQLEK